MYDINHLNSLDQPYLLSVIGNTEPIFLQKRIERKFGGCLVLNAKKMVDWEGFSKAMASVLEFPEYYGDNWDAFMDLIRDLSWLSVPKLTILIYNSEYLFRSQTSDKQTFQECINEAGAFWKNPSENGGWEDDLPKPFHVILKSSEVISEFNAPKIDLISD